MDVTQSVGELKGIGAQRIKALAKLGVYTIKDLLLFYPRDYDDRSNVKTSFNDLTLDEANTFVARVSDAPQAIQTTRVNGKIITKIFLTDGGNIITAVWFNQPYMKNAFKPKVKYIFTGKVTRKLNFIQVTTPEYEPFSDDGQLSAGRITPVYSSAEGASQKIIRASVKSVLDNGGVMLPDFLPLSVREKYGLCERNFAVYNIHFPKNNESFFAARRRLVFEELFLLQFALLSLKEDNRKERDGIRLKNPQVCQKLLNELPFKLTAAQEKVFGEITQDLTSGKLMNRLTQGDVGSGKTVVAMLSAYFAIANGYQAAIMAPTEVLARQHMLSVDGIFSKLGVKTVLLTGAMKAAERRKAYAQIESGEAQMVIGTHAVIQDKVKFKNLAIAITDEQHRFGVKQRAALSEKGGKTHALVMTATPIPRTLALILYGDLDISVIDSLPPNRQKIDTYAVTTAYRERIYNFIKKHVDEGRQAYIICPAIEENEKADFAAALDYTEELKGGALYGYAVECLHGKMKPAEKEDIMQRFAENKISVLVSTTVVEVGVNVPNATIMLIENSERFGLAQLHQLRGRVGRGAEKSYCILVSDAKNKTAKERMKTLASTNDGFEISEKDLKLRGPGDFFGIKQHGLPELKIANLYKDADILKIAQKAAKETLSALNGDGGAISADEAEKLKKELPLLYGDENISL